MSRQTKKKAKRIARRKSKKAEKTARAGEVSNSNSAHSNETDDAPAAESAVAKPSVTTDTSPLAAEGAPSRRRELRSDTSTDAKDEQNATILSSSDPRGDAAADINEALEASVKARPAPPPTSTPREKNEAPTRKKKGERKRVARMTRLSPSVNAMLEELASFRGIDLNAAISVAISEDHRRVFANRYR